LVENYKKCMQDRTCRCDVTAAVYAEVGDLHTVEIPLIISSMEYTKCAKYFFRTRFRILSL
jgi:hypothetical protein